MNYAIILAGGRGERFWPLSSKKEPKQFHRLGSSGTMFQNTLGRTKGLVLPRNTYIAANKTHKKIILKQLKGFGLPTANVFFEPTPKNTLPAIGLISLRILKQDREAVIFVLPSDHFINEANKFKAVLRGALSLAKQGYIVTLGARPSRPETGYGYIKLGKLLKQRPPAYKAARFTEKPDKERARRFLKSRRYLWNCGIFIFQARTIEKEMKKFTPALYRNIHDGRCTSRAWKKLSAISIDYAIMEKTNRAAVVAINQQWSDMGNWQSLSEVFRQDGHGNVFRGNALDLGSRGTTVWTEKKLVATIGLKDIIIINAKNGLLVCSKHRAQEVRKIVAKLKNRKEGL